MDADLTLTMETPLADFIEMEAERRKAIFDQAIDALSELLDAEEDFDRARRIHGAMMECLILKHATHA